VPQVVAIICSVALLGFAAFQIVLLASVPLARFAWGGEDHYLQPQHRPYAVLAIVGCLVGIFISLQGANLFLVIPVLASQIACYIVAGLLFVAFVLTAARSRSVLERQVMLPYYVLLAALFLIVALAGHP
jgi:hypothetical protein